MRLLGWLLLPLFQCKQVEPSIHPPPCRGKPTPLQGRPLMVASRSSKHTCGRRHQEADIQKWDARLLCPWAAHKDAHRTKGCPHTIWFTSAMNAGCPQRAYRCAKAQSSAASVCVPLQVAFKFSGCNTLRAREAKVHCGHWCCPLLARGCGC